MRPNGVVLVVLKDLRVRHHFVHEKKKDSEKISQENETQKVSKQRKINKKKGLKKSQNNNNNK